VAAGADGIIPKPIHQKAVLDMIAQARRRVAGETQPKGMGEGDEEEEEDEGDLHPRDFVDE
jgi:DNA-binding response OmpR family regulator